MAAGSGQFSGLPVIAEEVVTAESQIAVTELQCYGQAAGPPLTPLIDLT
jgi:hypothetical protein